MAVNRTVHFFTPGQHFPSVSITGGECGLECKHCGGNYLNHMIDGSTPEKLMHFVHSRKDIAGFLLSGGCSPTGTVDFSTHLDVIKRIKTETDLVLNVHTGLVDLETARALNSAGIELASVDVVGDPEVVKEVYGVEQTMDPVTGLRNLREGGFKTIVPHVCVGLKEGNVSHEFRAVEMVAKAEIEPEALVFISLIPTSGTEYADCPAPSSDDVSAVIEYARGFFPETPLLLGCMRSKRDRSPEIAALKAGADGVVLPSMDTREWAEKEGYFIKDHDTCCALLGLAFE